LGGKTGKGLKGSGHSKERSRENQKKKFPVDLGKKEKGKMVISTSSRRSKG